MSKAGEKKTPAPDDNTDPLGPIKFVDLNEVSGLDTAKAGGSKKALKELEQGHADKMRKGYE